MFRSLRGYNYRMWAAGAIVSNVGTWMQRTAQDWLVLTELTRHSATAVGIVTGLQFGPQVLLLPWTGLAADRFDRRKLLLATQTAMGVLALGLGLLAVTGVVRLWQVYCFAFLLGCAAAFDAPARQTFVTELVARDDVSNAVALNSTSFNVARLLGPAVAGVLIAAVGSGWVFLINAATFSNGSGDESCGVSWMKSWQKWFSLGTALIVTLASSILFLGGCYKGVSNNEIVQVVEVQTSSSNHVAMLVERSDYAALSGNTFFVFVSDRAYQVSSLRQQLYALNPVFRAGLGNLSIDWSGPNELTIRCHSCGDTKNIIETQLFAQNGIVIRYSGFP